jgi:hypothetical protein
MSLKECEQEGRQLPPWETCLSLCPGFPDCLPEPRLGAVVARVAAVVNEEPQVRNEVNT